MKMWYRLVPFLLVGLVAFYGCKPLKKNKTADSIDTISEPEWITLKAGPCRGKCKVYELHIDVAGTATFNGIKNTEIQGTSMLKLSESEKDDLTKIFDKEGFSKLENEYLSGARDLQVFEISYQEKTVKFHKRKAPENLIQVFNALNTLLEDKGW